jgi:hypothetical protein
MADSLIVVAVRMDGCNVLGDIVIYCDDVLVSLPQEDRVREVNFDFYTIDLANAMHRTDSMIVTLMINTTKSGFLLRWVLSYVDQ